MKWRSAVSLLFVVVASCSRRDGGAGAAEGGAPEAGAASVDAVSDAGEVRGADAPAADVVDGGARRAASRVAVAPVEARRSTGARVDGVPAKLVADHFGAEMPKAFEVQTTDLAVEGRKALLVVDAAKPVADARPLLVVTEGDGSVAWSKDRPAAGILPPVGPMALAAGPEGRVVLAVCDPPTSSVALRLWDDDGSPFADLQVLEVERCDDLSLLYWRRRGWIVAVTTTGSTRAQLVSEEGTRSWGRGIEIAARPKAAPAPVSLAADTGDSFVVVQQVDRTALAFRYDVHGAPLWPAAVTLDDVAKPLEAKERIVLERPSDGVLRARRPGVFDLEVRSSGGVRKR